MSEVELANVSVGSTRIVLWMESSLYEHPLSEGEDLDNIYLLVNNCFIGEGPEYFFPEFEMKPWVSTREASLYTVTLHHNRLKTFGRTDEALKANLTEYLRDQAGLIEKFNSVREML